MPAPSTGPVDVLVCVLDDVGREDLAATPTPTIDLLASRGARFERCYAMPVCSPTRYALLFGRWPRRSGMGGTVDALDLGASDAPPPARDLLALPEVLKAAGYQTALIGKWHLGRAGLEEGADLAPHVQGFDDWRAGLVNTTGEQGDSNYDWRRTDNGVVHEHENQYVGDAQRDAFVEWWTTHAGRPRFAWLAFSPPHAPFEPPPGGADLGDARANFLKALTHVDGLLLDCLNSVDLSTTLVIVVGDNGTPRQARPAGTDAGHWKGSTFEGGVRVPLIAHGPGIPVATPRALVSVVDVPRMLLDLLGLPIPADSFEDAQRLGGRAGGFLMVEHYVAQGPDDLAIVEERWKLRRFDPDGPGPQPVRRHVYDLWNDPEELNPFALTDPAIAVEATRLEAERLSLPPRN